MSKDMNLKMDNFTEFNLIIKNAILINNRKIRQCTLCELLKEVMWCNDHYECRDCISKTREEGEIK